MSEDRGIEKPGSSPSRLKLTVVGQDHVQIEVAVEAETFKEGFDKLRTLLDECRTHSEGYDQIAEVANVRPYPVPEQMPMPEQKVVEPVRVTADRKLDDIGCYTLPKQPQS